MTKVEHTLNPVYDSESRVLILGSMPSVKSRELGMYYGNKNNRFWAIIKSIYDDNSSDWKSIILNHHLALWDVIASCDIVGSSDASIKNIEVNDIASLLNKTKIDHIFLLGKSAYDNYNKYIKDTTNIEGVYLPSPSSANAQYSLESLIEEYSQIKEITG